MRPLERWFIPVKGMTSLMTGTPSDHRTLKMRRFQTGVWCVSALIVLAAAIGASVKGVWVAAAILLAFAVAFVYTASRIWRDQQPHSLMTSLLAPGRQAVALTQRADPRRAAPDRAGRSWSRSIWGAAGSSNWRSGLAMAHCLQACDDRAKYLTDLDEEIGTDQGSRRLGRPSRAARLRRSPTSTTMVWRS